MRLMIFGIGSKVNFGKNFNNMFLVLGGDFRIFGDEFENVDISVFILVVFDVVGMKDILGWEIFEFVVGNVVYKG